MKESKYLLLTKWETANSVHCNYQDPSTGCDLTHRQTNNFYTLANFKAWEYQTFHLCLNRSVNCDNLSQRPLQYWPLAHNTNVKCVFLSKFMMTFYSPFPGPIKGKAEIKVFLLLFSFKQAILQRVPRKYFVRFKLSFEAGGWNVWKCIN